MHSRMTRLSIALFLLWGVSGFAAAQPVQTPSADQTWFVDTHAACCAELETACFSQLQPDQCWAAANLDAFLATDDPNLPTVVFVPGNRATRQDAMDMAWQVQQQLKACGAGCVRMVAWSWPAERISRRNRPDVRAKACRSDVESHLLGQLLSRVKPEVRVSLVGYSFGARVIGGGLHLVSGGTLNGYALPQAVQRAPMRAVFVAAAIDTDWLLPGHRHGLATMQLEHLLVTVNSNDPGLRFYPLMYRVGGPQALGYAGPACCGCPDEKLELLDVTCSVGRHHGWEFYFCSRGLLARLPWYGFVSE